MSMCKYKQKPACGRALFVLNQYHEQATLSACICLQAYELFKHLTCPFVNVINVIIQKPWIKKQQ